MNNVKQPDWMAPAQVIRKADAVTVDNTSPAATQVNGFSVQFGVSTSGELNGDTAHPYHPSGVYAPPVQSTLGQPGTECVYVFRSDEGFYLGCRDTVNQIKAGTVYPGEISIYSPGATGSNKVYLNLLGDIVLSSQHSISQTVAGTQIVYMDGSEWQLVHTYGSAVCNSAGWTIANANGSAGIQITQTGQINIFGTVVNVQGSLASISGTIATCVGANAVPVPGVNGALYGPAGPAGVASANVFIGA